MRIVCVFSNYICHRCALIVQFCGRADRKPGGSPLLLPHVQISCRPGRSLLHLHTRYPVSFFPLSQHLVWLWNCGFFYFKSKQFTHLAFVVWFEAVFSLFLMRHLSPHLPRYHYFPNRRGVSGLRIPPVRRPVAQEPQAGRHNWGQGHRLGADWTQTRGERGHTLACHKWECSWRFRVKRLLHVIISYTWRKPSSTC